MTTNTGTEVGNYFVSNYPPFSQWKPEFIPDVIAALDQPPRVEEPLGLYLHIPFCRKRCPFCLLRRRYALLHQRKTIALSGRRPQPPCDLEQRRRGDVRMRAGHAQKIE